METYIFLESFLATMFSIFPSLSCHIIDISNLKRENISGLTVLRNTVYHDREDVEAGQTDSTSRECLMNISSSSFSFLFNLNIVMTLPTTITLIVKHFTDMLRDLSTGQFYMCHVIIGINNHKWVKIGHWQENHIFKQILNFHFLHVFNFNMNGSSILLTEVCPAQSCSYLVPNKHRGLH